jgi:hypothetical protein
MSRERELLSTLVDMLERSNTAHLNYSIIDGNVVYADDLIKAANECLEKSFIDMNFCPECGNSEFMIGINLPDNEERICTECGQSWFADIDYTDVIRAHLKDRISLKQELENPLPEPVMYIGELAFNELKKGWCGDVYCTGYEIGPNDIPLYAEPPARKPLTDDEIRRLWGIANGNFYDFAGAINALTAEPIQSNLNPNLMQSKCKR